MESLIAVVLMVVASGAGLLLVASGLYSVAALLFDELFESDQPEAVTVELRNAA